ncbi:MAG: hypothetical protein H6585_01055 [Flavobacteriales bacterium]|nr:hypothetical protein [Flavobacteriales bacterium]MCB9446915.1 hypothetical protein [Flavobacteriales bacterium]
MNKKSLDGATVTIKGDKKTEAPKTKKGKVESTLFHNVTYTIEVSHPSAYTISYTIDTKSMPKSIAENYDEMGNAPALVIDAELIEKIPGFEASLFKQPLQKWSFDKKKKEFAIDQQYDNSVRSRLNEYLAAASAQGEEKTKLIEAIKQKEAPKEEPKPEAPKEEEKKEEVKKEATEDDNATEAITQGSFFLNLTGKVTELGRPVIGASINIETSGSGVSVRPKRTEDSKTTDKRGAFSIPLLMGQAYTIIIFKDGYYSMIYYVDCGNKRTEFTKSYSQNLDVEMLRLNRFKKLQPPKKLEQAYDKLNYKKRKDEFQFDAFYAKTDPDAKAFHEFFDDLKKQWEEYYKTHERDAPVQDEPETATVKPKQTAPAKEEPKQVEETPIQAAVSPEDQKIRKDVKNEEKARENKVVKEEEESRLRSEMEEQARLAREEEERRLKARREAEAKAMVKKMEEDAEARAVVEEQAHHEAVRQTEAKKIQVVKTASNVVITQELAKIEREEKIREAEAKAKANPGQKPVKPTIKPKITVKNEDGYLYDTKTIAIRFPGKEIVLKEVTSLWGSKTFYLNDEEIPEDEFKKYLSQYHIQ